MDDAERLMLEGWSRLPQFKKKIQQALSTIEEALAIAPAYVACSWGKDSTVLLHICQQVSPGILAFHYGSVESSTGLVSNFPEVINSYRQKFKTNYQELIAKPEWAYTPDTVRSRIADAIDQRYQLAFVGVRAEESRHRRIAIRKYGKTHQYVDGSYRSFPLAYWSTNDVWAYIVVNELPYLDAYEYSDRTNPHAVFWFSQSKDFVATQHEVIKRHNPNLSSYLLNQNA